MVRFRTWLIICIEGNIYLVALSPPRICRQYGLGHGQYLVFRLPGMIKVLVLKYGSPVLHQKTRPFFLGIVLGQFVAGGLWLLIDGFTGIVGNRIPVY